MKLWPDYRTGKSDIEHTFFILKWLGTEICVQVFLEATVNTYTSIYLFIGKRQWS